MKKNVLAIGLIALVLIGAAIYFSDTAIAPQTQNAATLAFTVKWADGTQTVIESNQIYSGRLSVVPLTIYVNNKAISSIDVSVKVKLDTGGRTVSGWSSTVTQRMEIYKAGASTPLTSSTGNFNNNGVAWANGETKTVSTVSLTAGQIEGAIMQYSGNGTYNIQVVAQVSMTVNTAEGTETLSGSAVGSLTITFQNYVPTMSMTATVSVSPLQLAP